MNYCIILSCSYHITDGGRLMYKLLLVSDREEVLKAFEQVQNWELHGFRQPHIRHDYEGMLDSLSKHHSDGISIALSSPEEEDKAIAYLQEFYPAVSLFEAGSTPEEVLLYLKELKSLLNRVRADVSNNYVGEAERLQYCRHEFIRKVLTGEVKDEAVLRRKMKLLRSKMEIASPCLLFELDQTAIRDNRLVGRWLYDQFSLEMLLRSSLGGNFNGLHILPVVESDGRIFILACPLRGSQQGTSAIEHQQEVQDYLTESIEHLRQYKGIDLHINGMKTYPGLISFCSDKYDG